MSELSRRGFLKLSGGVVAGVGAAVTGVAVSGSAEAAVGESERPIRIASPDLDEALRVRARNVSRFLSKVSEEA